ncbi:MAG: serine/threonine-protein kinase [Acidobacteria bacterium]|nr:serine/threonine-protein kinase [Acidobacteriota bacterium]
MKVGSVLGHYHVIRTLGRGGMGAVYEASDTRLNRQVALKVLPAKMASNPEWFKRFEREAQAVASLNHPNIVTIHSVEEVDDVHFIILELVGGKTLDELIPDGGLSLDQFFDVAIPLTDAIAAAHKRGIAHRDLKPSNVMVDEEDRVKVLDFGIAKLITDVPEDEAATQVGSEALTEEGKIVGTVAYMSPEQAEGKASDHRTDIFSLGIMLYEMATGDRPFVGDTKLSILASIVKDTPPPIIERNMELPRHLSRIVKKALEKDLDRRYQSVVELRNDLIELKEEIDAGVPLITGGTLTDPRAMDAYRAPPAASPWGQRIGVAGIVIGVAALAWAFFGTSGTAPIAEGPSIGSLRQLTTTSGVDFAGTISDDGDWFAFTRRADDGSYSILLQSVGSRNPIHLVDNGVSPAFSPNGERIAFSGSPVQSANIVIGGGISIMGRTGDDVRRLTDEGFNPAWSPDGTKLVYSDEFVSWNPYTRQQDGQLHILDIASDTTVTLELDDGVQPNWSPNGHRITYWANSSGQRDIWTVPAEGGEGGSVTQADAVPVTQDEYIDYSPVWSPDGSWLYFASTRGGSMAIWRVAIDEMSGETLGEPQQITSGGLGDPGMLSFSADGTRLLYTSMLIRGSIVAADFDPDALTLTSETAPVVQGTRRLADPHVTADGELITYRTAGAQQDIFVAGTDGSNEQQVTDDLFKDWGPRWSPEGDTIAFYTNVGGDYEIWVMNADGSGRTRLTDTQEGDAPQRPIWSPDGNKIATFMSDSGRAFIIDADKTFDQQTEDDLPDVPGGDGNFQPSDWSPDGRSIVGAVAPAEGTMDSATIWRFDLETREYELLADGTSPAWMADGVRVLFRNPETAGFYVVNTVSRSIQRVRVPPMESMVLSADNLRAYLVQVEEESDIWLLEIGRQ